MFVCTVDHFGLFIRISVACNLQKSVLLNIKQLIVSASYKETLGRQNQSTKCATFCTPERCQSMFKVLYFGAAEKSKMASKMVVFKDYEGSLF